MKINFTIFISGVTKDIQLKTNSNLTNKNQNNMQSKVSYLLHEAFYISYLNFFLFIYL